MTTEVSELEKISTLDGETYKPSAPHTARVVSVTAIAGEGTNDEVCHIVIDISTSAMAYVEGQSLGVIPPGITDKGKPHKVRLYSIASSREGDEPGTVSICVKRLVYTNEAGEEVRGVCSNYLCDLKGGEEITVTGPVGKTFFLPADHGTDLILLATGTGIAPYRAFLRHIFEEKDGWSGRILLYFGARYHQDLLYCNHLNEDLMSICQAHDIHMHPALSRETDKKVYVQHKLKETSEDVMNVIGAGNFSIYMCGLKGMEKGIEEVFTGLLANGDEAGWKDIKRQWRKAGRYNVEVY